MALFHSDAIHATTPLHGKGITVTIRASVLNQRHPLLGVLSGVCGEHGAKTGRSGKPAVNRQGGSVPMAAEHHALLVKGSQHQSVGRFAQAESCYRRVIKADSGNAEAWHLLGLLAYQAENPAKAEQHIRKAVSLAPANVGFLSNLGLVLKDLGHPEEAEKNLKRALEIEPNSAAALNNLGLALQAQERFAEAESCYRQVLEKAPQAAQVHSNLGLTLRRLDRLDEAETSLKRALELSPDNVDSLLGMASALGEIGKLEELVQCCEKLFAVAPGRKEILGLLAAPLVILAHEDENGKQIAHAFMENLKTALPDSPTPLLLDYITRSLDPETATPSCEAAIAALPGAEAETITAGKKQKEPSTLPQQRVVALLAYGRSGTGFLHSLVDGHPQITTLPGVYMKGFFGSDVWPRLTAGGIKEIGLRFAALYEVLFDAANPQPVPGNPNRPDDFRVGVSEGFTTMGEDGKQSLKLDRAVFLGHLDELMEECGRFHQGDFFRMIHVAFEKTTGREGSRAGGQDVIFYHIHNPNPYELLNFLKYFPDAKLLMTVREPLQNLEALIPSGDSSANYTSLYGHVLEMLHLFSRTEFGLCDSAGIHLEDLKNETGETLRRLSTWIGVEPSDTMGQSTMQGLKWWGEPGGATHGGRDQFDKSAITRKVGKSFSERDRFILGTLFYPFARLHGYVEEDDAGFAKALDDIAPLIGEPFDFERALWEKAGHKPEDVRKTTRYRYLRLALRKRWEILRQQGTYPAMIPPLPL